MNKSLPIFVAAGLFVLAAGVAPAAAQAPAGNAPYHVTQVAKVGGAGGFDYVSADSDGRRLYVPRGDRVTVFDLDTLQPAGEIPHTASVHGVAIDPAAHHAFSSSKPVVMWDTATLVPIKTIAVEGGPDGILFDPATERVFVLSHRAPNATVIDARDGTVVGTIDLGGAPEQGASDGRGHVYFDVEDKDQVAVVDARTLQVTAHYDLGLKDSSPAGLALDAQHGILFAFCRTPSVCMVVDAASGGIITRLPIGSGTDGGAFNPATLEAFSSQGDGTLTVIKEEGPDHFAVEQTVRTRIGAKTCTLDAKTGRILLITAEYGPLPAPSAVPPAGAAPRRPRRGPMIPDSFAILAVGR
jgi:DNA-binding beta-propeller fold protein YncE